MAQAVRRERLTAGDRVLFQPTPRRTYGGQIGSQTGIFSKYRVSIKSLPDDKYLVQENYVEYNLFFFQNIIQEVFLQHISTLQHVLLLYST